MLIVMKADATEVQVAHVCDVITELGFKPHPMPGATRTAIGITGNPGAVDPTRFENLPGVSEAIRVSKPYKLITLDLRPEKTIVRVGDAAIGGDELAIIAGPCAIESHAQAFAVAESVRRSGARFFRGGAFKPRTSPYAFQGLGVEGLKILAEVRGLDRSSERRAPPVGILGRVRVNRLVLAAVDAGIRLAVAFEVETSNGDGTVHRHLEDRGGHVFPSPPDDAGRPDRYRLDSHELSYALRTIRDSVSREESGALRRAAARSPPPRA